MTATNALVTLSLTQLDGLLSDNPGMVRSSLIDHLDLLTMVYCLKTYNNNQTRVAEVLGINRGTLRKRMADLGLMGKKF